MQWKVTTEASQVFRKSQRHSMQQQQLSTTPHDLVICDAVLSRSTLAIVTWASSLCVGWGLLQSPGIAVRPWFGLDMITACIAFRLKRKVQRWASRHKFAANLWRGRRQGHIIISCCLGFERACREKMGGLCAKQ